MEVSEVKVMSNILNLIKKIERVEQDLPFMEGDETTVNYNLDAYIFKRAKKGVKP